MSSIYSDSRLLSIAFYESLNNPRASRIKEMELIKHPLFDPMLPGNKGSIPLIEAIKRGSVTITIRLLWMITDDQFENVMNSVKNSYKATLLAIAGTSEKGAKLKTLAIIARSHFLDVLFSKIPVSGLVIPRDIVKIIKKYLRDRDKMIEYSRSYIIVRDPFVKSVYSIFLLSEAGYIEPKKDSDPRFKKFIRLMVRCRGIKFHCQTLVSKIANYVFCKNLYPVPERKVGGTIEPFVYRKLFV